MTASNGKQFVLSAVQRSVPLTCLAYAVDNLLAGSALYRAAPSPDDHLGGARIDRDIAYAQGVADRYLRSGPIRGRIAEVGPGGSAAVALHLIAQGADHVDLVDRFEIEHDRRRLDALYAAIIERDPRLQSMGLSPGNLESKVGFQTGEKAAAEVFFANHDGYDAILSNAVLEHLDDPIGALRAMAGALKPGGRMVHQVDLRDHGMFSAAGHEELTFLTIPTWIYERMRRRRGRPNRVPLASYRRLLEELGLSHEILVTHLVEVGKVEPMPYGDLPHQLRSRAESRIASMRDRLAVEYRDLATEDMAVSGFLLVTLS